MEKSVIVFVALLFCIPLAHAQKGKTDVIYLKNGSIINGQIISLLPTGQVKIKTRDHSLWVFESAGIDSISKGTRHLSTGQPVSQLHPGYFNLTEAGFLTGNSGNNITSPFSIINISGWHFSNRLAAGIGTGVEFLNETYLPVVSDIRYTIKREGVDPFFGIQGGYSFALDKPDKIYSDPMFTSAAGYYLNSNLEMKARGGFLLNPFIGIITPLGGNLALTISAGYRMMRHRYTRADDFKIDIDYNRLSLKFGLIIQ